MNFAIPFRPLGSPLVANIVRGAAVWVDPWGRCGFFKKSAAEISLHFITPFFLPEFETEDEYLNDG